MEPSSKELLKTDIISYLKILAGLSLTFPLTHVFFALDYGLYKGGLIAIGIYFGLMLIGIPMFNYLEYGVIGYWVNEKKRKQFFY